MSHFDDVELAALAVGRRRPRICILAIAIAAALYGEA